MQLLKYFRILLLGQALPIMSHVISVFMQSKHIDEISVYANTCFTGFNENLKIPTNVLCEINTLTDLLDTKSS